MASKKKVQTEGRYPFKTFTVLGLFGTDGPKFGVWSVAMWGAVQVLINGEAL